MTPVILGTTAMIQSGYVDLAVFSRVFKNYYGLSPYTHRKKYSTKCKEDIYISEYNKAVKKKKWVQEPFSAAGELRIEYKEKTWLLKADIYVPIEPM